MLIMEAIPFHQHITRFIDSFTHGSKFNIVMEYCERGDLGDYIRRVSGGTAGGLASLMKIDIPEWRVWHFVI